MPAGGEFVTTVPDRGEHPVAASEPSGSAGERAGRLSDQAQAARRTRLFVVLALAALAVVTALWFRGFRFDTWMGDDLYAWAFYNADPSFHDLFLTASGGKYRPVTTAIQWSLFQVFPSSFPAWTVVNAGLEFLSAGLVFFLVRRLARGDLVIPFAAALVFVTSRFSYYNVFQAMGTMEAVAILLFVLILYLAVVYLRAAGRWPGLVLAGLFLAITLTHERYLALFPFLALLVVFKTGASWRFRSVLVALLCVPPVLNVVLKRLVFATSFLMGTGGEAIGFQPAEIARYMVKGLANMVWFNWGPDYLSGITMSETGAAARVLVALILIVILVCVIFFVIRVLRITDGPERRAELKWFVLWLVLVLSLLLVASITIRQEYRWLYAPFIACLVYFSYQYARLPWRPALRYVVLIALCVMVVAADHYYRDYETNVFFFYGESIANSARDATVGVHGDAMAGKTVYVEKARDIEWILGGDLFLSPYLGVDYRKVVWLDSFDSVDPGSLDPAKSVFLRMDWAQRRLVDVTGEVLPR